MFLSIATTHSPATDLGYLLHKHPERVHETELPFGKAYLFYPAAGLERCEAALVLDVDPIGLVRGRGQAEGLQDQYVNDRPYAASSLLSVAITRTLRSAMAGSSKERPDLAETEIPLEARVTPLPARGGEGMVRSLFEPLGWTVEAEPIAGAGGAASRYVSLRLSGRKRLRELLTHLYVLIPVLDDDKHYWVGEDEVTKLLDRGKGWLEGHPARETIVGRYLKHRRALTRVALARLLPEDEEEIPTDEARPAPEDSIEAPIRLNDRRHERVVNALKEAGAKVIADLGCSEGKLLARLVKERWVEALIGVDASARALEFASKRLRLKEPGGPPEGRVTLLHGALTYRDRRWSHADAAVLVEVIEHLDADRLPALTRVVFGDARPRTVIVTTPNAEYNALFPTLAAGAFRHPDHRFEWTRGEFVAWAREIERAHGYTAAFADIGEADEERGPPTQMAAFTR